MLKGHIDPTWIVHIYKKKKNQVQDTSHITAKYVPETNLPLKYHICQLVHLHISDNYVSICASYELNANNSVTTSTGIHTFHINDICPKNMPITLHMYIQLHNSVVYI